jgi:hypothetical protein
MPGTHDDVTAFAAASMKGQYAPTLETHFPPARGKIYRI